MKIIRVYYQCVLYEDIDEDKVPTDKAKSIANRLDTIGISKFNIIYELEPEPPADQYDQEPQPTQPQQPPQ